MRNALHAVVVTWSFSLGVVLVGPASTARAHGLPDDYRAGLYVAPNAGVAWTRYTPAMGYALAAGMRLYRRPLDRKDLQSFDAVILDPPRAGAAEQVAALSQSGVGQIAYVSCNPATFARDAKMLADGGYVIAWVQPVGQFRWSTHVELAAAFSRGG